MLSTHQAALHAAVAEGMAKAGVTSKNQIHDLERQLQQLRAEMASMVRGAAQAYVYVAGICICS